MNEEVGVGEIKDRELHLQGAHDSEENQGGNEQPGHQLLGLCHYVYAQQVDGKEEGQKRDAYDNAGNSAIQGGDNVAQISGCRGTEQG
ncbi:hypothetical protein SDC9_125239 [bioreactor metagenome]|uniref:Uncharacterized protein n=1 Tax=bioreactor metagenome TaxID=1076179 RepID=A0A645CMU5_9ZZZZ